jgi:hypothetical protein
VGAAHAIALAMYQHEPDSSAAKPWLQGMVASSVWVLGFAHQAPVSDHQGVATGEALRGELIAAGRADLPGDGDPREPAKMYARGAYRMLAYALGLRDELPVQISADVARRVLGDRAA